MKLIVKGLRVSSEAQHLGLTSLRRILVSSFLIQGEISEAEMRDRATRLLVDPVTETFVLRSLPETGSPRTNLRAATECPVQTGRDR